MADTMTATPDGDPAAAVTRDTLLGGRVVIFQPAEGYRVAVDPVLLAAACPARPGERAIELGCGTAAALLCLAARQPELDLTGVERDGAALALAGMSVAENGLSSRCRLVEGDVAALPGDLGPFEQVLMNPPFLEDGEGSRSPQAWRDRAHHGGVLADWVAAAHAVLAPKGWLTTIHRADRFDRLVALLAPRFGAITLIPLLPRDGAAARRVIVRARKGVRSPAAILPPLVLHRNDGCFTVAADRVLQGGAALDDVL
ncbi:MAG: methyltransferase [Azospirillaceae bacterium]